MDSDRRRVPDFVRAPWYKWAVVGILWFVAFLNAVDRHAIYSIFPLLEKELGMSAAQLGLLGSAFVWAYAALLPFAGYAGDRYPRERIIAFALVVWSIATALNAFVTDANHLIFLRAFLAIGEVFYLPAAFAFLTHVHPERTRGAAIALHLSAMSIGQVFGGAIGGYIGEHYNWKILFIVLGASGICYVPILWSLLHTPPDSTNLPSASRGPSILTAWRQVAQVSMVKYIALAFVCYSIAGAVNMTWLPYFLFESFDANLALAGFTANFYLELPTTLGVIAWGYLGDYFGRRYFRGRVLVQAVSLLIAAPLFLAVGWSQSLFQVATSLVILGLLRGGWPPNTMPVICQVVPQNLRSTTYGAINSLGNIAAGLAAVVAGILGKRFGLGVIFATCSLVYWLASASMGFAAFRRLEQDWVEENAGSSVREATKTA